MESTMNCLRFSFVLVVTMLYGSSACGHGTPIQLAVIDNRLIVNHPLDQVFAPPIFGQGDNFDDFAEADFFQDLGNLILWDMPGLDIHGMNDNASLSIEILARPVVGSIPNVHRQLWYWNSENQLVESSPAEFHLLGTGARSLSLHPESQQAQSPFLLANNLTGETGYHNHTLVFYGLDDDAIAPAGVYGFFARFTSDSYASSDPFLIVFNYFTDNELLESASRAIYAAGTLPGDYDLDNDVDGRDFLVWQRLFGSTTRTVADNSLNGIVEAADLAIWQAYYGERFGAISVLSAIQVPEPVGLAIILTIALVASQNRKPR
jgi:hypothetical protein